MKSTPTNRLPLITLCTDFGAGSQFVGVMHGVILSLSPMVHVIDLCHTICPHDTCQAACLIAANYRYFPSGSIHVIVVDPSVGSNRRIILLESEGYYFLAPDNGILSPVAAAVPSSKVWAVNRPDLYLKPLSQTFHGRDIFAPIAAYLAMGCAPQDMGSKLCSEELTPLSHPEPRLDYDLGQISGAVIYTDHFGNVISNISRDLVEKFFDDRQVTINIARQELRLSSYYNEAAIGETVALFNSDDLLEIAVNQGRASDILHVKPDDRIIIAVRP
jgi:S-adenosylmethionine hydrolase